MLARLLGGSTRLCTVQQSIPGCTRSLSALVTPVADYGSLAVSQLQKLLEAAAIDYRDCFEKKELVQRLQENEHKLPDYLKGDLASAQHDMNRQQLAGRAASLVPADSLFLDEQYVVSLFQANRPSVVHVTSLAEARPGALHMDPIHIPQGRGSGFLWDSAGHVVTNFHVIQRASAAKVTLYNNETYNAVLRGAEPDKDLAVLKIEGGPLPFRPVSVGSSHSLQVGQKVFAIGNPFGLDQSMAAGIVSGLGREVRGITGRTIRDVVQTDAAINPGNSGGPLLDSKGRLIGVNTMIYSPSGASSGVGFAIPSDTVRRVVNQLIRYGRVIRPGLGVTCLPDQTAAGIVGPKAGVIIAEVIPGSGAAQAGLRGLRKDAQGNIVIGDVVVAVGAEHVSSVEDLVAAVERFNLGDLVPLTVKRGNQSVRKCVRLLKDING
ncbi:hypothetical protein WJX72_004555 [[Myrmecia] bisecta]|uniref:PDZ domain-containing protein n=1 Tax=[Myrmecia] bisecta TaxID=41462 RepID=A0AAW1PJX7_9CHLO